ncbi:MAG: GNAT family N-acetyltransferase [Paeniclostridium sordellii]|uniref:GNAT family N-acetyltransferase n=1 Tax=Paeniclostridium hominis TaxID=2764329 RepID=A0ABR7JZH8_9FIRM|nr:MULTISPECIES: GNAT family N-acetyltransferase [Paeniclostridium]MBC6002273.1 GNAT family N-acetyltransferase [Paeniclostridium hominis]MDU2591070.1 GNAT family N-acetyltransferase [Paeniclostridium sordellii]
MNIRYAIEKDLENIKDIWNYCFGDEEGFVNYYFDNKYKPENTILIEENDELMSSLQLNQYKINLNNKIYDTSYVVGVSTYPNARGKGYMKDMMDFALNELYKKDQLVSLLMPIDYRLYKKYGYEHCYDKIEYKLNIEELKQFKIVGDFEKITNNHINYMMDIYNEFLLNTNGYVVRDKNYYENLFKEIKCENGHMYIHKEENYEGYIIYFIMEDTMFIREICYKNISSLKSMLKFIYNHNTQCKKVTIMSPVIDSIRYILPNLKTSEINIKPFMMGRVINLEKFLNTLSIECNDLDGVYIEIIDNQIKENNNVFEIRVKDNEVKAIKSNKKADIGLSINYISQLAFSYIDIEKVLFLENITKTKENTKAINLLKSIFSKKENYINEYV